MKNLFRSFIVVVGLVVFALFVMGASPVTSVRASEEEIVFQASQEGHEAMSEADETVSQWIAQVERVASLPDGIQFRQDIVLKALIFTWRFHSDIYEADGRLHATSENKPKFLDDSVTTDLIEVMRSPSNFDLTLTEEDDVIVLAGDIKHYPGNGPLSAVFWIDPSLGVIVEAEVKYDWGTLFIEQDYTELDGHTLLKNQFARTDVFGARIEVTYSDYAFSSR